MGTDSIQATARTIEPAPPGTAKAWDALWYSHTHWDREWYQPFERFRMQLVGAVDGVLDTLAADPRYSCFTLDGQTIVLEDYLELRPERREQIVDAVRAGRLEIGPWYILPDEFLVSGESIVRNLLLGRSTASRFGTPIPVGYLPDPFGHIAQMPQILRGFGIETAIFSRGIGDEFEALGSEFWWRAPDGTSVLAMVQTALDTTGYCNAERIAQAERADDPGLHAHVDALAAHLASHARTNVLLFAVGTDHETINPLVPDVVEHAQGRYDNMQVRLAGLQEAAGQVQRFVRRESSFGIELGGFSGELRNSRYAPILSGIFSARIALKQDNARLQTMLERYVEPITTLAAIGRHHETLPAYLERAWRLCLKNQPHDSIGGCSVDAVHDEMPLRTKRALELCVGMLQETATALSCDDRPVVFNPQPYPCGGMARRGDGSIVRIDELPALGLAELEPASSAPARAPDGASIEVDGLRVHVEADGSLVITRGGQQTRRCFELVDIGDAGDEYDFGKIEGDTALIAEYVGSTASVLESGVAELRLVHRMDVPLRIADDRRGRFPETAPHDFHTVMRLCPGQPWVECETHWHNQSSDHRVRLRMRLGALASESHADGHFNVVTRPAIPAATHAEWAQQPGSSHHCERFAAIEADGRGIAVLTEGLNEYEVVELSRNGGAESALEVTLLRSVGWLSRDDVAGRPGHAGPALQTPGAQCLGLHRVRFGLLTYDGTWEEARLPSIASRFAAPPLVLEPIPQEYLPHSGHRARAGEIRRRAGRDASSTRFSDHGVLVDGGVELSALKRAEDGSGDMILRVYNPYGSVQRSRISFGPNVHSARIVRLDERDDESLPVEIVDGKIDLQVAPRRITTVRAVVD